MVIGVSGEQELSSDWRVSGAMTLTSGLKRRYALHGSGSGHPGSGPSAEGGARGKSASGSPCQGLYDSTHLASTDYQQADVIQFWLCTTKPMQMSLIISTAHWQLGEVKVSVIRKGRCFRLRQAPRKSMNS